MNYTKVIKSKNSKTTVTYKEVVDNTSKDAACVKVNLYLDKETKSCIASVRTYRENKRGEEVSLSSDINLKMPVKENMQKVFGAFTTDSVFKEIEEKFFSDTEIQKYLSHSIKLRG